jgi:heme exporter protein A
MNHVTTNLQTSISTSPFGTASQMLLQAQQLFCERDERILFSGLCFELYTGQLMQVMGSNGSGKTSLLRILCGLNDHYEGEILWCGEPANEQRERYLASLLYIGHRGGVNRILTPRENLRWSAALHAPVDDLSIESALARVGLRAYEDIPCRNLSAGQTQRVALARLLISPAILWVLDEPFTTLDVQGVKDLEMLLAEHVSAGGSILLTTHHQLQVSCDVQRLNLDDLRRRP